MANDTIYGWSEIPDSNATADATAQFPENMLPSAVNDGVRAIMARIRQLITDLGPNRTSTGAGNAYAVTADAAGAALSDHEIITFVPHASNTAACTINVAGRGAKPWRPAPSVEFTANSVLAGVPVTAFYRQLTDEWISPGTGYYVNALASGVALQSITARLPQIGDMVVSFSPTPGAGRIRLTETTQAVLKSDYPELNSYLSGLSYPWGSDATHFNLPPAAGYYLRFAGTTSSIDTAGPRAAGSTQADQNKTASIPASGLTATSTTSATSSSIGADGVADGNWNRGGGSATTQSIKSGTGNRQTVTPTITATTSTSLAGSATLPGGDEVRVKNVAFYIDVVASTALAAAQVAVFGFPFQWDSGVNVSDRGSGRLGVNNSTPGLATSLIISNTDGWGAAFSSIWAGASAGDFIVISKVGSQANRLALQVSSAPISHTGFYEVPVTVRNANGSFSNNDNVAFEYAPGGVNGVTVPDISGLTEDTAPDVDSDYTITYDASASVHKKVHPAKFSRNTTRGDVTVRGASIDQRLGLGTSGYLLGSDGTDLTYIGFIQAGTGAGTRTWQAKARERITPEDYTAAGNGTSDDSTPITNSLSAIGTVGGKLQLAPNKSYLTGSQTIPAYGTVIGGILRPEQVPVGTTYYSLGSALRLKSGATLTMNQGSAIASAVITRDGQTQGPTNDAGATTFLGQFAGTAITAPNIAPTVRDTLIVGHNVGIAAAAASGTCGRIYLENLNVDCNSGLQISGQFDICRLRNVHCWPFATAHISGVSTTNLLRSGVAFALSGTDDWMSLVDCFSYGYVHSVTMTDVSGVDLIRCQADTASSTASVSGFYVLGTSYGVRIIDCRAVGQQNGVIIASTSTFDAVQIKGGMFASRDACINITQGDAIITGATCQSATHGIYIGPSAGDVVISNVKIDSCTNGIYIDSSWTGTLYMTGVKPTNCTTKFNIPSTVRSRVVTAGMLDTYALVGAGAIAKAASATLLDITVPIRRMTGTPSATLTSTAITFVSANGGAVTSSGSSLQFTDIGATYASIRVNGFSGLTTNTVGWITTDCLTLTST